MTAVEFIRQEFLEKLTNENYKNSFDEIINQAKEMEKKHKQSDYMRGWNDGYQNKVKNPFNDNPKSE